MGQGRRRTLAEICGLFCGPAGLNASSRDVDMESGDKRNRLEGVLGGRAVYCKLREQAW